MKLIRDIGIDLGTANVLCYTSSKPSKFAFASDEKSIRQPTTSFVRCYLRTDQESAKTDRNLIKTDRKSGRQTEREANGRKDSAPVR